MFDSKAIVSTKIMQSSLEYFKEYTFSIFFILMIPSTILFCYWEYGHTCCSITLIFLTSGAVWFYRAKTGRKPIRPQDLIVITGCDSGLGYSLALHCHEHLNIHVIAGAHNENSQGAKNLKGIGISVHSLDITQKDSMKTFVQSIKDRLEADNLSMVFNDEEQNLLKPRTYESQRNPKYFSLRSVVNNAGTMIFGEFEWQTENQIYHQINVNLLGTMLLTRKMLPLLRLHSSRLIIVTSHCALEPLPGVAAYCASKAGLAAWVTALRVEVKKYGIDVVNFIPGSFIQNSNILSQQKKQFEIMAAAMTTEAKQFYSDYFKRYVDYLSPLSKNVLPQRVKNPRLYKIFEDALLQQCPRAIYKCEPWRYMFYHVLFKISPIHVRDWLMEKFIQMPTWHKNNLDSMNKHFNQSSKLLSEKSS